jgi:glycosyltransferase involved in cell wall biosynthesis
MMPRVSLLMAAYNRADYIAQAIDSVLKQTFADWELLVWDDGSNDDTLAVAQSAAHNDPRIKITAGEHAGQHTALNHLAKQATGEFIGWLDSDDMLAPTALAETVAAIEAHPEAGMVYTSYVAIDSLGRSRGIGRRCQIPYSKDRLLIDFMTFHFRLIRKALWDQLDGLHPDAETAEDYDLCLRISEVAPIHHLNRPLYFYRVHDDSVSTQRRVDQIRASERAIQRALVRRGMDKDYELKVEIVGRFQLRRKSPRS